MKRIFKITLILFIGFTIICGLIYLSQEKLIFHPEQLAKNHKFQFDQKFEELNFKTNDNQLLNALLFKSESSKGLIFYLHGNLRDNNIVLGIENTPRIVTKNKEYGFIKNYQKIIKNLETF